MLHRRIYIILFCFLASLTAYSQSLKGIITNNAGEPVPYATVYVDELKHGTTSNIKGEYELKLEAGSYTVFFQSLGFSPDVRQIKISDGDQHLNIKLQIQYYVIPEVRVTSTGEDPAYAIMRKAIGLAPYHLNRLKTYEADVYIKGSVHVRKIPKVVQKQIRANDVEIKEGDSYLIESINQISYEAPDKYKQVILAQQSTFPEAEQSDISPMDVVKASFYEPVLADIAISPLAPNAMSHYKFSYEGSTPQGNFVINKINVIPKRKSQQVFSGTIYIIEDIWCIHSLDLLNENLAGSINIKQVYTPVQDDIWMPVSHNFDVKVSIVGVKADGVYGSAITYNSVVPNNELEKPVALSRSESAEQELIEEQRELSREQQKIEEILSKEELNNRDMNRLSRLMEEEAEKTDPESRELEVKETTTHRVEEGADKRPASYWEKLRPIPLSDDEYRSIRISDSLKLEAGLRKPETANDSLIVEQGKKGGKKFVKAMNDVLWGETWHIRNKNSRYRYGGLIDPEQFSFNPVDGFRYANSFNYYKVFKSRNTFNITPEIGYAFARKELTWRLSGLITYKHMKMSRIVFSAQHDSREFTNSAGIYPPLNLLTSLFLKESYMRLYDSKRYYISHRQEYFNGFYIDFRYTYEERDLLSNNSEFSFFKRDKDYLPNLPENYYLDNETAPSAYELDKHDHHDLSIVASYIPRQKYRIVNERKIAAGSDYPTFKIYYTHGFNISGDGERNNYDHIKFEADKRKNIGAFGEYSWRLRIGGFLNSENLQFQDFNHFNSQSLPVLLRNHQDVFMLPDYYTLATPEYYAEAHFRYTTPYLFLKLLPFLSNSLMRENISLAYLYTPHTSHYYELGYGLSEVFLIGKIGIYVGFEDLSYKSAGFKFTFIFD